MREATKKKIEVAKNKIAGAVGVGEPQPSQWHLEVRFADSTDRDKAEKEFAKKRAFYPEVLRLSDRRGPSGPVYVLRLRINTSGKQEAESNTLRFLRSLGLEAH